MAAYSKGPQTQRARWDLHGDAQLIVIAGSDSVAAALSHIFFYLAWDPILAKRLQAEFDALTSIEHDNLTTVDLLDGVIYETMRLHPPVPSGTQRVTPPEGMRIGKHFIPGDTIVQVPSYTLFRDERAFVQPDEFIPERWTTRPELVKDKSVYIPFNIGELLHRASLECVEINLGLTTCTSRTVRLRRQTPGHAGAAAGGGRDPLAV